MKEEVVVLLIDIDIGGYCCEILFRLLLLAFSLEVDVAAEDEDKADIVTEPEVEADIVVVEVVKAAIAVVIIKCEPRRRQ